MVLVFRHQRRVGRPVALPLYVGTVWALAYAEELIWDKAVWRDREWLFGAAWDVQPWLVAIVPALAVPQLTHYVLDGFIWRRSENPDVALALGGSR